MNDSYINELKKIYDDKKVSPFIQEVCEYFATRQEYNDESYTQEIEPKEIVEPVYTLFMLQRRELILDELSYVRKRYPNLFSYVEPLYENILVHMDMRSLEEENALRLSMAIDNKVSSSDISAKVENLTDSCEDLTEALDKFYSYLHSFS